MEETPAPDPFETVRLLKSDFELLQAAANAAQEDFLQWCALLGIAWDGQVAPRTVMYEAVFPAVVSLLETKGHVVAAESQLRERASRFGNTTKSFGNGTSGLLVGKKIPGLFEQSRRERREAERKDRRGR